MRRAGAVRGVDEEVVIEGGDVEENGFIIKEQLRKEG